MRKKINYYKFPAIKSHHLLWVIQAPVNQFSKVGEMRMFQATEGKNLHLLNYYGDRLIFINTH